MKYRLLLLLQLHAVMSENQRILPHLETAAVVLFLHSPSEPFRLLLRCRVELRVASLELMLPSIILTFDSFPFALPIQNKFHMYCAIQHHERHAHTTRKSFALLRHEGQFIPRLNNRSKFAHLIPSSFSFDIRDE